MRRCLLLALILAAPITHAQSVFPGQSGDPVGYAAIGSLGTSACPSVTSGTSGSPNFISNCKYSTCPSLTGISYVVFMSVDFNCGTDTLTVDGSHITFYGSRIQSNNSCTTGCFGVNTYVTGAYETFMYTSITPLASQNATPPGYTWPSAGAGENTTDCTSDAYCTPGAHSYQYGIQLGSSAAQHVYIDHADVWGFGNSIDLYQATVGPTTIAGSQIHDAADPDTYSYHTDGPGYLNSGAGVNNVIVQGNTIASLGNTNGIAFQAATSGYSGLLINFNYLSGFGKNFAGCDPGSTPCTNSTAYGNVFGTDVMPYYGPNYGWQGGTNSVWACNKIAFATGTTWTGGDGWTPVSGDNGKYWLYSSDSAPSSSTDQGGNTICGILNPGDLAFKAEGTGTTSSAQTVTLTNGNSATLTISSVALETGTQFTISANTCGSSLTSGSSCTISVEFTPGAQGPQTDQLQITDNSPSSSSPEFVPLIGLGTSGSGSASTPTFSPGAGTYVGTQTVAISTSAGTVICWNTTGSPATNGATGCTTGTLISGTSGNITVSSSETVYAVAGGTGYTDSSAGSAAYVIVTIPATPNMNMLAMFGRDGKPFSLSGFVLSGDGEAQHAVGRHDNHENQEWHVISPIDQIVGIQNSTLSGLSALLFGVPW